MADASVKVLGFAGSLRKGSLNRMLLRAAAELAPPGMTIETFDLVARSRSTTATSRRRATRRRSRPSRSAIRAADALLVATPEYNYGVPGVLKNAIDWASRPPDKSVLNDKPAADHGRVPRRRSGRPARSSSSARPSASRRRCRCRSRRSWSRAPTEKFDADGRLTDEKTRKFVRPLLVALQAWTERLGRGRA